MSTAQDVYAILGEEAVAALQPWADAAIEQALAAGMTPGDASERIYAAIDAAPYEGFVNQLYWTFGIGSHFKELNLLQALGLQPADPVLEKHPPARVAQDAVELIRQGWHYTGDTRELELDTEAGRAEYARRDAFGKILPPSWQGVDPLLYWYLVLCNRIPSVPAPFGVRQSEAVADLRGLSLQQWLDNEHAQRERKPLPWPVGRTSR